MTTRRYEMGRPVYDQRAEASSLANGGRTVRQAVSMQPAAPLVAETSDEREARPSPAKVVRRPPPVLAPEPLPVDALPVAATEKAPPAPPPEIPLSSDEEITDTSDMRKFLLKQMVRAAKGEITTETVKNIVTLSQQVYNATSLELKAAMILKNTDKSIRALELVSPQDADQ
ncbi:hypothetical protein PQR64_23225 [Paraburkholderia phytofirmans]|uniref:hypothetical protein n=1 Tax=Paraburkholderia phytofirmans TaxID=261302 RepID=UPI0038BE08B5